eukprot:gene12518-biopygen3411
MAEHAGEERDTIPHPVDETLVYIYKIARSREDPGSIKKRRLTASCLEEQSSHHSSRVETVPGRISRAQCLPGSQAQGSHHRPALSPLTVSQRDEIKMYTKASTSKRSTVLMKIFATANAHRIPP